MNDEGSENGGGAPLPPKRPTVIRSAPKISTGRPVRPAPPAPGMRPRPLSISKVPDQSKTETPPRSHSVHGVINDSSSSSKSKRLQSGKKRPEITIVDARPMSEIGFHDIKSASAVSASAVPLSPSQSPSSLANHDDDQRKQPPRPARPASMATSPLVLSHIPIEAIPTGQLLVSATADQFINAEMQGPSKPKRPSIIRPTSLKSSQPVVDENGTTRENNVTPPPRPSRPSANMALRSQPPGLVESSDKTEDVNGSVNTNTGPPKPMRTTIIRPQSRIQSNSGENGAIQESNVTPPPRPSRPSANTAPSSQPPRTVESSDKTEDVNISVNTNTGPPKPMRASIIRPHSWIQSNPDEGASPSLPSPPPSCPSQNVTPPSSNSPLPDSSLSSVSPASATRVLPSPKPRPRASNGSSSSDQQNVIKEVIDGGAGPPPSLRPLPQPSARTPGMPSPRSDMPFSTAACSQLGEDSHSKSSRVPPPKPRPPSGLPLPSKKISRTSETDFGEDVPVYAKINKSLPRENLPESEARQLPFQIKLRSTLESEDKPDSEQPLGRGESQTEASETDRSRPTGLPKPTTKPKPLPKPRPGSVLSPVQADENLSSEFATDNRSKQPLSTPLSGPSMDSEPEVVLRRQSKQTPVNPPVDKNSHVGGWGEEQETVKPNHLSGVLLAKFENLEDVNKEENISPPIPSKSPFTIIGAPRQKSQAAGTAVTGNELGSDSVDEEFQQMFQPPVPSKRQISIIGGSRRSPSTAKIDTVEELREDKTPSQQSELMVTEDILKARTEAKTNNSSITWQEEPSQKELAVTPVPHRLAPPVSRPPPPSAPSSKVMSESSPSTQLPMVKTQASTSAEQKDGSPQNQQSEISPIPLKPSRPTGPPPRPSAAPMSTLVSEKSNSSTKELSAASSQSRGKPERPQAPCQAARPKQTGVPPLPARPGPDHSLYHYMSKQPHGIALHDYKASQPDEVSFLQGATVVLVKKVDNHWMIGRVGSEEGMFPVAFIEIKCPPGAETSPLTNWEDALNSWPISTDDEKSEKSDTLTGPRCRARFDFEGEGDGELTIEDGDVIQILERVGTEWLRGENRGRSGIFPSSFVEVVEDFPPQDSTDENLLSNQTLALYDFKGQENELNFQAGDTILIFSRLNADWLYGECNGCRGQLPASFVSHIPPKLPEYKPTYVQKSKQEKTVQSKPDEQPAAKQRKDPLVLEDTCKTLEKFQVSHEDILGYCRGIFDYVDPPLGDLEFRVGDRIEILEFIGEEWGRGRLGQITGMFPLKFVAEEVNSPPPSPEPEPKVFGRVLHDFNGESADDLVLKEGDIIEVEDFADIQKNWRWGVHNGKRGMFPVVFVEIMS